VTVLTDLKYESHYFNTTSEQVKAIVSPLFRFGVTMFDHFRIYEDNTGIDLTTIPHFCEFFAKNHLYREACVGDWDQYHDGYYFWDTLTGAANVFKAIEEQCQSSHGIIIRKYKNYCDQFHLAGALDNPGVKNFFINSRDMIENFIDYYYREAEEIISNAREHSYSFPGDKKECDELLYPDRFDDKINFGIGSEVALTKREFQCIEYTSRGYSAKLVADFLNISRKTVERHLENSRKKLGVNNKLALVKKVINQKSMISYDF